MRKFVFLLLMSGMVVPTMASAEMQRASGGDDDNPRAERVERVERTERAERPNRSEAGEQRQRNFEMRRERSEPRVETQRSDDGQRTFNRQVREREQAREQVETQSEDAGSRSGWSDRRRERSQTVEGWQPREREVRTIPNTDPVAGSRDGERRYDQNRSGSTARHWDGRRWGRDWRSDRRYDWRRHRDRNRSSFRIGFYFDPFGWSYRRYRIGSYMSPYYYRSNYWINDPWQYRLPPVYGPYRWVRYHNDALLIDTWSGQVVDIIYGFFW